MKIQRGGKIIKKSTIIKTRDRKINGSS